MSSDCALRVDTLGKCYHIYDNPRDRLKQFLLPRVQKMVGLEPGRYRREFWALREVSFEVGRGETVGIIGRNGSGKSTLLQLISGTVVPTTGVVKGHGRIVALLELGAGFNMEFSGRENVWLNAAILGLPPEAVAARMARIVEFSELGDFFDQPVKNYSSGMYARLAFSIAIHVDPDILIIDETLSVGDARFVAKCMRRIKEIKERGVTILFVSHDVAAVRTLCDRVIWLDAGRLVEQGDVFPVTGRYMESVFADEKTPKCHACAEVPSAPAVPASLPNAPPVTHWGSHKGLILTAMVRDEEGRRKDTFLWGTEIQVVIEVRVPKEISREHLSIAFSIKDLKGTDLIVSTTRDFQHDRLPDDEFFTVFFSLKNPLVAGKYLLVAAVENRQYRDIHYYEYLEGAHYFSCISNEMLFGLYQPPIRQRILGR